MNHSETVQPDNRHPILKASHKGFIFFIETLAGLLVLTELLMLFIGVISRYVFHKPIIWTDEVASLLFLWMAMIGAAVALQHGLHMRMTAIVDNAARDKKLFLNFTATASVLSFLLLIAYPAFEYALDEVVITLPTLGVSSAWRAAAMPVGIALMLIAAVFNSRSSAINECFIKRLAYLLQPFWYFMPCNRFL